MTYNNCKSIYLCVSYINNQYNNFFLFALIDYYTYTYKKIIQIKSSQ